MKKWIFLFLLVGAMQAFGELQEQDIKDVVEEVNPATPVRKVTQEGLDKTINQVSPVEISLEPGIVRDEKECEKACDQERDTALSKTVTEIEKGYAWRQYAECRKKCPDKAAQQNELNRGPFGGDRVPAGAGFLMRMTEKKKRLRAHFLREMGLLLLRAHLPEANWLATRDKSCQTVL